MSCQSLTKSNKPCKIIVSSKTESYNGKIFCHVHLKKEKNTTDKLTENKNEVQDNLQIKSIRCNSVNKNGKRCLKYTTSETKTCSIHQKSLNINNMKENKIKLENKFEIKSPSIHYKINNHSDSCYVCLEETENKLSCGHFVHSKCLLELLNANLNLKIRYNYLEYDNKYFIITECQYCKQISIIKNIPNIFKLKKQNTRKNKIKVDDYSIFNEINNIFLNNTSCIPYVVNESDKILNELKEFIFDKISVLIFDNYLSIKNNKINTLKIRKINSKSILNMLYKEILKNINIKYVYNNIRYKLETFVILLEKVVDKILKLENTQEDIVNLINIF